VRPSPRVESLLAVEAHVRRSVGSRSLVVVRDGPATGFLGVLRSGALARAQRPAARPSQRNPTSTRASSRRVTRCGSGASRAIACAKLNSRRAIPPLVLAKLDSRQASPRVAPIKLNSAGRNNPVALAKYNSARRNNRLVRPKLNSRQPTPDLPNPKHNSGGAAQRSSRTFHHSCYSPESSREVGPSVVNGDGDARGEAHARQSEPASGFLHVVHSSIRRSPRFS
jgi:hypothetical protein